MCFYALRREIKFQLLSALSLLVYMRLVFL